MSRAFSAEAEVVRRALWVDATPERRRALAEAAMTELAWDGLVPSLEQHGILGLFARNLGLAGVRWPPEVAERVEQRLEVLRADARRDRATLEAFLAAAARSGIVPVLLKGSSLGVDLYPEPHLRAQGDVDLLVRKREVRAALAAAQAAGLSLAPSQLPVWWYRLVHFHLKVHPLTALRKEIELHWRLQHPALLLTPDLDQVFARARPVAVGPAQALTLDPLDRWIHLVTHLFSHGHGALGEDFVRSALADADPPVRLKWVADIAAETERIATSPGGAGLRARILEWGAAQEVADLADLCAGERLLSEAGLAYVRGALGPGPARKRRTRPESPPPAERGPGSGHRPHPALDFRLASLGLLGQWFWPPLPYLRRRYPFAARRGVLASAGARCLHAAGVGLRALVAALLLPVALAGRALGARGRRRRRAAALRPEAILDLVADWRGRDAR